MMLTATEFDVLRVPEIEWCKIKVIPPWIWLNMDISKLKENDLDSFLWEIEIDKHKELIPKECLTVFLEEYERRTHIGTPIQLVEVKNDADNR